MITLQYFLGKNGVRVNFDCGWHLEEDKPPMFFSIVTLYTGKNTGVTNDALRGDRITRDDILRVFEHLDSKVADPDKKIGILDVSILDNLQNGLKAAYQDRIEKKGIWIGTIISYLKSGIAQKNKELAMQNLHYKQESFCEGDWFLKLAFMDDSAVEEIAKKILG